MIYIILLTISSLTMGFAEVQQRDVCPPCDALEECEQIVCSSTLINGSFVPEYVIGCELACPFGEITCQKHEDGKITWSPVDPCSPLETTTQSSTLTFTPFILNSTLVSTDIPQINTTTYFNNFNQSITSTQSTSVEITSPDSEIYAEKYVGLTKAWTLFWLVPLILFITVPTLFFCCLVIHHLHKHRGKVKFPLSKKHIGDVMDSSDTWVERSQPQTHSKSKVRKSQYPKTKNNVNNSDESPNKSDGNTDYVDNCSTPKYSKFKSTKHSLRSAASPSLNRRLINWQDSGMHEFAVPPSPKSAAAINMSKTSLNHSPNNEINSSQTPLYFRDSSPHLISPTLSSSSRYPEELRSVSQCSMLLPKTSSHQATGLIYSDYQSHRGTTTTFNPQENHNQLAEFPSDKNHFDQTVAMINYEDGEDGNMDTCDQVSSIVLNSTVQQQNPSVFHHQSFNAFTDNEHPDGMYDSNYDDWTIGETTIQRIPRI
uniref:EGF-like domain-containing protein n=1 Tax=Trichobilharzia regenti TaxID=157069 RepID=A0AA85IQB8_TRIRE|nr:unnamed protein product [Trichobilharzia regenti]